MIICPKCSFIMPDGSNFCSKCGEMLSDEAILEPQVENIEEETSSKRNFKKVKIIGVVVTAWVLIVAILLSALYFRKTEDSNAVYIKNGQLYFAETKKPSPRQMSQMLVGSDELKYIKDGSYSEVANILSYSSMLSKDGKILFFFDKLINLYGDNPLYYRYVEDTKTPPTLIDEFVSSYTISDDGKTVTYIGEQNVLYRHDLKKRTKLAENVLQFCVSEDGKNLLYFTGNNEIFSIKSGHAPLMLANNATFLYANGSFDFCYFYKEDTLYKIENGDTVTKIDSDIFEVISTYKTGEVYYVKNNDKSVSLKDKVIDDKMEEDRNLQRPQYVPYPARSDYNSDAEYEKAIESVESTYEKYENDMAAWSQKIDRDNIREQLQSTTFEQSFGTLYFYDGEKKKLIDEYFLTNEYSSGFAHASDNPVLIYSSVDFDNIPEFKMSDIANLDDLVEKIDQEIENATVRMLAVQNTTSVIGYGTNARYIIAPDGKLVYYVDELDDNGCGDLYKMKIPRKKAQKPTYIDSNVVGNYCNLVGEDKLYYFKNLEDNTEGDLFLDGRRLKTGVRVYHADYSEGLDSMVFMYDWNDTEIYGTLAIFDGENQKILSKKVRSFDVTPEGEILYIENYDKETYKGDLMSYKGGKPRKIDKDVMAIVSIAKPEYDVYSTTLLTQ